MPFNPDGSWTSPKTGKTYPADTPRNQMDPADDAVLNDELKAKLTSPNPMADGSGTQQQGAVMGLSQYGVPSAPFNPIDSSGYKAGADDASVRRGWGIEGGTNNQSRMQQQNLIQMLQAQANGTGPSIAQNQLKQATDRNIAGASSMAASGRGPGAAMGAYNANNMAAQANQGAAMDSAILRSQEQMQAQSMLGAVLGQTRGQDLGMANMQIQSQMQQQQMRDNLVMFYTKLGYDADQANRQAQIDMEKMRMQAFDTAGQNQSKFVGDMTKTLTGGAGGAMTGMSM